MAGTVYVDATPSNGSSIGALIIIVILAALALLGYYMYKKPCDLKEHIPKLHKWIFKDSDIKWPSEPKGCEEE